MAWTPISRVDEDEFDDHPDPNRSGLRVASLRLDRDPPDEWVREFNDHNRLPSGFAPFRVDGDVVTVNVPRDEEEKYGTEVNRRIAATNEWYEREVVPRVREREAAEHEHEEAEARSRSEGLARLRGRDPEKQTP
jgi:hypothetical protein